MATTKARTEPARSPDRRSAGKSDRTALVCAILAVLTLAAFSQVLRCDFVNFDDNIYVTENPHVLSGITMEGLRWAFNAGYASNWHPLTWMSHIADCQVFGLNAAGHHATNLLLHVINAVLLLLILRRVTGSLWKSNLVAALFAIHPLHVESVAWISERKDVLSTLFWMLTMGAYLLYAERPGIKRYVPVLALYSLGLMAKPMLVTLPFALLLLDYWPLRRIAPAEGWPVRKLILEKLPMLALAAGSSALTVIAQSQGGSVAAQELMPLAWRIDNALVAAVAYMMKMLLPIRLAAFYPHPEDTLAIWKIVGSALLLLGVTVSAFRVRRTHPYIIVGWAWYLLTLAPTIGIIQVGRQSMADRYTYIPLIGLFTACVWGIGEFVGSSGRRASLIPACAVIVLLAAGTWIQAGHWRNSGTLWEHAISVTDGNYVAHLNLGKHLADQGDFDTAISHYRQAIEIQPDFELSHYNLGVALSKNGMPDEAIEAYRETLRINPEYVAARVNLAAELQAQGKIDEALAETGGTETAEMHYNTAVGLQRQRRYEEAEAEYRKAIEMDPGFIPAHNNLSVVLFFSGDYAAAWEQVKICRKLGIQLPETFIEALSQQMPEP